MVEIAKFWIPIVGGGVFISWGLSAYFGGSKSLGVWLIFVGAVSLLLLAAIQWQASINSEVPKPAKPSIAEIAANRAYIAADTFGVLNILEGQVPRFQVMVRNKGQTPARNVRFFATAVILPHPFPDTLKTLDIQAEGGVPITLDRDTAIQAGKTYSAPLTADEMGKILGETHRMTFMGEIRYEDVFGGDHVTRFCIGISGAALKEVLSKRGPNGDVIVAGTGLWHYCPRFNEAT